MSRRHHIVQDDTAAVMTVDLVDRPTGQPIDVSGATVVNLYLRAEDTDTILDTVLATKLSGRTMEDGTLDSSVVTLGAGGRVQFAMPITFTQRAAGQYEGEIEITYSGGAIQTVYDMVQFSIRTDF